MDTGRDEQKESEVTVWLGFVTKRGFLMLSMARLREAFVGRKWLIRNNKNIQHELRYRDG